MRLDRQCLPLATATLPTLSLALFHQCAVQFGVRIPSVDIFLLDFGTIAGEFLSNERRPSSRGGYWREGLIGEAHLAAGISSRMDVLEDITSDIGSGLLVGRVTTSTSGSRDAAREVSGSWSSALWQPRCAESAILRGEKRSDGLGWCQGTLCAQAVMPRARMCSKSGWTWAR